MLSGQYGIGNKCDESLRRVRVDDRVLLRNVGAGKRWMEGFIIRQKGSVNYEVGGGGRLVRRHLDQLMRHPLQYRGEGRYRCATGRDSRNP